MEKSSYVQFVHCLLMKRWSTAQLSLATPAKWRGTAQMAPRPSIILSVPSENNGGLCLVARQTVKWLQSAVSGLSAPLRACRTAYGTTRGVRVSAKAQTQVQSIPRLHDPSVALKWAQLTEKYVIPPTAGYLCPRGNGRSVLERENPCRYFFCSLAVSSQGTAQQQGFLLLHECAHRTARYLN